MKKIITAVSLTLIAPLLAVTLANAQDATTSQTTPKTTTTTTTQPKTELTAAQKTAQAERLEKRKVEMKIKITTAEKQRLQSRCKNSQGVVSKLDGRIKGIETSRSQVHENLITRLTSLSQKLASQGIDTTTLDSQIIALQERIVTFKADLVTYQQAVSDLATMDCAKDPEAFKASLEAARAAREKVNLDVKGIRTYLNETVKPGLQQLRGSIDKETTSGGDQ